MSQVTTPEPKAPTADELVAAVTNTQPVATTPAELEFKFPDGSVVKGKTQDELLQKAAQRYTDSRDEINKIKSEAANLRQQIPPTTVKEGEFDAGKFWEMANSDPKKAIMYALASEFEAGSPENFKETMIGTVNAAQTFSELSLASSFMVQAGDFPSENPKAAEILTDAMEKAGVTKPSVEAMLYAHSYCLKNKLYEPAKGDAPPAPSQQLNAPPMLNQGATSVTGEVNLEDKANLMSAKELRAAIEKLGGTQ